MDILASKHHITLEEIGRLEAQKAKIEQQIAALRATLPKNEPARQPKRKSDNTDLSAAPIATILAPEAKVEPRISDHAVIRYLERRFDFDFNAIRNSLLTNAVKMAINMGAQAVKVDGGKFMIRDHTVTTFVPRRDCRSASAKRKARRG